MPTVIQASQFRPLVFGVPLAESVAESVHPVCGVYLFSFATHTPGYRIEILFSRMAHNNALLWIRFLDAIASTTHPTPSITRHQRYGQAHPGLRDEFIASRDNFIENCGRYRHAYREQQSLRPKCLERQMRHDDGIFTTREQQHRPLEFGSHLLNDVDHFSL